MLVDKTCNSTVWITPKLVLDAVRYYFNDDIWLDPATEPNNPTRAIKYYTKEDDGLSKGWGKEKIFVNPPYGMGFKNWAEAIGNRAARGAEIIALLPGNRTETEYIQKYLLINNLTAMCFIRKRLRFLRPDGTVCKSNPYGSVIWGFNCASAFFLQAFCPLGKVLISGGIDGHRA